MTGDARLTEARDRRIPTWAPTVEPGWTALLDRLHGDLLALDPDYRIERFGMNLRGLRLTVADRFEEGEFDGEFDDRATALTHSAETASERICETCGNPGRIRLRGNGPRTWMQSSCDTCRTLPVRQAAPADTSPASSMTSSPGS
ncbi:hypothetical protein OG596_01450 [Streptomyces sp. NBC_01102]|uniref:hypothetical protein n=1 Tax=Streptomyces sp. NBC_01102 TaxID=2903749 RepID=UPI00386434A1|nr:hypothetical protein OG596_01450 [Streptomyces sp. NBC_01102]